MATFGTFVAGQVLTAAELNAAGTWQDYTPTWTQSATITKTVNFARYTQFNKLVCVQLKMTASSAGTADNVIKVGLPVNASSNNFLMGNAFFVDDSVSGDPMSYTAAIYDTTSTVKFFTPTTGLTQQSSWFTGLTASSQSWTIGSGDFWYMQLTYEAA
jgi:hypothetical protein